MSYILDALKKAESERNLGAVPDLHAQAYADAPEHARTGAWRKPWLWIAAGIVAAAAVAIALIRPWTAAPITSAPQPPAASPVAAVPAPAPALAAAPPATAQTPPQTSRPAPTPVAKKTAVPASPKAATASAPAAKPATPPAPPAPQADNTPIPTLRELPDNIRQEIPKFSTNGFLYSANKADRTVLINQKLLHEGDQVAPDLTLETLTPGGMVLNYKGYRYRTSY
jgi:general secretion pathway protein B